MEHKALKNKFNSFDFFILVTILSILLLAIFLSNTKVDSEKMRVSVKVSDKNTIENIRDTAKDKQTVYINGSNIPVTAVISGENTDNGVGSVNIELTGPGKYSRDSSVFAGQRILINQKVEIHGNYVAQGYVTEIKNAN